MDCFSHLAFAVDDDGDDGNARERDSHERDSHERDSRDARADGRADALVGVVTARDARAS